MPQTQATGSMNANSTSWPPPQPTTETEAEAKRWPPVETMHSTLLGLAFASVGIAPRAAPVVLVGLALLTLIEALRSGVSPKHAFTVVFSQLPLLAALAFLAFSGLSALWAADRQLALQSVLQVGLVVLATGTITGLMPEFLARLPQRRRLRFVRAIPLGGGLGLAFVLTEFATGNAISLALVSRFPDLMGDNNKDFVREGTRLLGFAPFYLDRNVAALALAMPAVLLAIHGWLDPFRAAWALGLTLMVAIAVLALSWSGAAKFGALCGVLAALALWRWPKLVIPAMTASLTAGISLALPLGHLPARLGLDKAAWMPPSARERVVIWDRTATAAWRSPVVGIGVQSTRFQATASPVRIEGVRGPRRELGWHAHNFVLQSWLETGAIGALLLLAVALSALRALAILPTTGAPAGMALFVMVAAVGVTGWGLWQPWLIAVIGTAIAGLRIDCAAGPAAAR